MCIALHLIPNLFICMVCFAMILCYLLFYYLSIIISNSLLFFNIVVRYYLTTSKNYFMSSYRKLVTSPKIQTVSKNLLTWIIIFINVASICSHTAMTFLASITSNIFQSMKSLQKYLARSRILGQMHSHFKESSICTSAHILVPPLCNVISGT